MMQRRTFLTSLARAGVAAALPVGWLPLGQGGKGPASVLVIRHGEEPPHGRDLNDKGRQRANALRQLFPSRFPKPTAIFATKSSRESARPFETVEPLAAYLGLRINDKYTDDHYAELAKDVLTDPALNGGHVLIAWHRGTIRDLARELRVADAPVWPELQYDHIWVIQYGPDGKASFSDESQHLLPGDK